MTNTRIPPSAFSTGPIFFSTVKFGSSFTLKLKYKKKKFHVLYADNSESGEKIPLFKIIITFSNMIFVSKVLHVVLIIMNIYD